jgi:hypothetical protein
MDQERCRYWLLSQPRPARVRMTSGSKVSELAVAQGMSFATVARSILAVSPDLIEALDSTGNLIRAVRPAELDDDDDDGPTVAKRGVPLPVPATSSDPETARFELFARLLSEAYKHSTSVAFDKLAEISTIMGNRGEALERSLASTERLLHQAWRENVEIQAEAAQAAVENQDPVTAMIGAFAGGQQQARTEAVSNVVTQSVAKAVTKAANGKPTNGKA